MADSRYRGAHYFPIATVRRVEDGIASYNRAQEYGQVSRDGVLFMRCLLHVHEDEAQRRVILLREILHPTLRLLHCAAGFYRRVSYRGGLTIDVAANNIRLRHMLFLPQDTLARALGGADDFQCFEDIASVSESTDSEQLSADIRGIVQDLMRQMCWSFWQSLDPFPADTLNAYLQEILTGMGFR
jgi:hypothetical protein